MTEFDPRPGELWETDEGEPCAESVFVILERHDALAGDG